MQKVLTRLAVAFGPADWRTPLPPIDELVCTILSQNTNDRNRDLAYQALRRRFATWEQVLDRAIAFTHPSEPTANAGPDQAVGAESS